MTIYVSLGKQCHIATELKKRNLRKFSLPYDWLYIGCFSDIVKLLNSRNSQLFDYKAWEIYDEEANQFRNKLLENLKSRHFFNRNLSNFDEVTELFKKRTTRLFELFEEDEEIIFIRDEQWYDLSRTFIENEISAFSEFFRKNYPKLKWKLILLLDSKNEKQFQEFSKKDVQIIYVHSNNSKEWYRPVNPWNFILSKN